jgi:hypothetical protein
VRTLIAIIVTLTAITFAATPGRAADRVIVKLSKSQVATVCGNTTYCEKKCGLNGEYTCGFGCGAKSCSGSRLTCPTGTSRTAGGKVIRSAVTAGRLMR